MKLFTARRNVGKVSFHGSCLQLQLRSKPESARADDRLDRRTRFDVAFSMLFLLALHGFSAFKILIILYVNYSLATKLRREYVPWVTWIFNIGILFANELGQGYPYASIVRLILPWPTSTAAHPQQERQSAWGTTLDSYGGLLPRWEILFNITVLRLISFNLDYYWSLNGARESSIEVSSLSKYTLSSFFVLTATRRNNSILPAYPNEIELIYLPKSRTTYSETILLMPFTRPCILQVRF